MKSVPSLVAVYTLIFCHQSCLSWVYCPTGYVWVASTCLRFYKDGVTWEQGRQKCTSDGAHLAILDTIQKRDTVMNYMQRNSMNKWFWIDGTDIQKEGDWVWYSTNAPLDVNLWRPGEPNNVHGQEHCAQVAGYDAFNDNNCGRAEFYALCETPGSENGAWGAWGNWSGCSLTCGTQGLRYRSRQCDNPAPLGHGKHCPGSGSETEVCFSGQCPVDGAWSVWTHWSTCSKTCGQGSRTRHRDCNNPPPSHNGTECQGESVQNETCASQVCPVHGGWDVWANWTVCSASCGGGTRSRTRTCTKPEPKHGGRPCPSSSTELQSCNQHDCPTCQVHALPGAMSSVSAPRINEKEYVRYYCLPDYTYVSGNLIRTCQANGALSGAEPECKVCCGKTKAIPNGEPNESDKYVCEGKGVGYVCHVGYRISNTSVPEAVCDSQKLKVPVCEPSGTCDATALRDPKHGFKVCEDINSGKTCHMRCEDGYKYVARDKTFYCNPETGWSWGLPQYGGGFLPSTSVEDCEVGDLLGVDGGLDGIIADVPFYDYLEEDQIKTEVADGVRDKLNTLGKCSKSCEVKDVQVKRAGTVKRDTMVTFNIRIVLHIRGGDTNASSLSEVKANVLRLAKSIQSTASAIKQVLQSTPIVISVNGQYIDLQTDNLVISRPRTGCRMGSIKSGIKCYRCPRGTYHDTNDGDCLSCPFGHYQDNPGKESCIRCPKGKTTDRIGVSNATQCKGV